MEILRLVIDIGGGLALIFLAGFFIWIWAHNARIEKQEKDESYAE
jgi:hypothetical protein